MKHRAFTLIELLIVISLIGLISVAVFRALDGMSEKTRLVRQQQAILNLIQEARSLALGNLVLEEESISYYKVVVTTDGVELLKGTEGALEESLKSEVFDEEATLVGDDVELWYFAPDAELCWDASCSVSDATKTFTLSSKRNLYTATIDMYREGGYADPGDPILQTQ